MSGELTDKARLINDALDNDWEEFEKKGDVKIYYRLLRRIQNIEKFEKLMNIGLASEISGKKLNEDKTFLYTFKRLIYTENKRTCAEYRNEEIKLGNQG
jgi:hypothetical protein